MKSEDILIELEEILSNDIITKNDLMIILKKSLGDLSVLYIYSFSIKHLSILLVILKLLSSTHLKTE